ncbi:NtaA/DmoA family FMN-dependent monooxygenase [Arthrobacter sp. Edens01]|uniref:NtaA/DmoA family FMN-dependent monooxygenase n=1 Tax=Arthrobacter sp. Edens01 TaxID=1732020 RepID=UPI0009EAA3C6|nr:NtaA/DmoA family FMN-dependent monooxygenase [Arthrobacter sp. Edens01]
MNETGQKMVLTTFMLPAGYHKDSWRKQGSRVEELPGPDFVRDLTLKAEEAKLHAVFFGDMANANAVLEGDIKMNGFYEPVTTLSSLAAVTKDIGLIGTISTSFESPYTVARLIAGVDHMSKGRAGWNVVTSGSGFQNYGVETTPSPAERYARATEFVSVVQQLWDSWADDAVIVNRKNGAYTDNSRIRKINHRGEYFNIEGPMPGPRSPQGRPVIVQAGSSAQGVELGSSIADGIYTAQPRKEPSVEFYAKMKDLIRSKGRNPDHTKILPGIVPILGSTVKEAEELSEELKSYVHLEHGRAQLGRSVELDLTELDFDERIPSSMFVDKPHLGSRYLLYKYKAVDQGLTLREMIIDAARSTGHQSVVGTPEMVADVMIDWFEAGACDGFNLNAPYNPGGFDQMCTMLVPLLQERGYFRDKYEGTTLRENLGLPIPPA